MKGMFEGTYENGQTIFDKPIGMWNVSKVSDFYNMFSHNVRFNQHLDGWVTSSAENMENMFRFAASFNGRVPFDTRLVTRMNGMFFG